MTQGRHARFGYILPYSVLAGYAASLMDNGSESLLNKDIYLDWLIAGYRPCNYRTVAGMNSEIRARNWFDSIRKQLTTAKNWRDLKVGISIWRIDRHQDEKLFVAFKMRCEIAAEMGVE